jgi:hypothetical protein
MTTLSKCALCLYSIAFIPPCAAAQQTPPVAQTATYSAGYTPELKQALQRIGAIASDLLQSMPSFTCDKAATSQAIRDGKVIRTVQANGTVRALRDRNGSLNETYTYKRSFHLLFIPSKFSLFVGGGFDSALFYFLPVAQPCYRYTLSPGRIDFETRTGPVPGHICQEQGLKGFALLSADGNITHIERTIPQDVAKPLKLTPFAAIDLVPIILNGRTYQLSHHMVAEMPLDTDKVTGRFEATYTNCHLFTATVTLGPATEIPPADTQKPQ